MPLIQQYKVIEGKALYRRFEQPGGDYMRIWYPGSTPSLYFYVKDASDALVDPGTSIKVSVYDPNGTQVVTSATATKISTGYYYYIMTATTSASLTGVYSWFPETTDTAIVMINAKFLFKLQKPTGD